MSNNTPSETPSRWLDEGSHADPDLHLIGEALAAPSSVSDFGESAVGNSRFPARADHVHGFTITDCSTDFPVMYTGWARTLWDATRIGPFLQFRLDFQRTGANITAGPSGILIGQYIADFPTSCRGSGGASWPPAVYSLANAAGTYDPNTGRLALTSVPPGAVIATGTTLSLSGFVYVY